MITQRMVLLGILWNKACCFSVIIAIEWGVSEIGALSPRSRPAGEVLHDAGCELYTGPDAVVHPDAAVGVAA